MSGNLAAMVRPLLAEIDAVVSAMPGDALEPLIAAIAGARRIALYGQGRTGLVMQGLTMRLYHLGREAHFVGAMNAPPLRAGAATAAGTLTGWPAAAASRSIAVMAAAPGRAPGAASPASAARPRAPAVEPACS